jgi:putative DNA primase/helicase
MTTTSVKSTSAAPGPSHDSLDEVHLIRACDVVSESIHWLWRGWIARRKLHILAGHPGEGKTTIALDMAAKITTGGTMPDGSTAPTGTVLFYTAEDGLADTIKPRFEAAGGDSSRLVFVSAAYERGKPRDFDPATDLLALQRAIQRHGDIVLVIIDPVVTVLAGDGHNNAEVRRALQPLVTLSEACNCAVIGITHFNKGGGDGPAVLRLNGSVAFGGLARLVLVAHRYEDNQGQERRVLVRAKTNIGRSGGGFLYELAGLGESDGDVAAISWGDAVTGSAESLLGMGASDVSEHERAKRFITDALRAGELPAVKIYKMAGEQGISERTLKRAKAVLPVDAFNTSSNAWYWRLRSGSVEHSAIAPPPVDLALSSPVGTLLPGPPVVDADSVHPTYEQIKG